MNMESGSLWLDEKLLKLYRVIEILNYAGEQVVIYTDGVNRLIKALSRFEKEYEHITHGRNMGKISQAFHDSHMYHDVILDRIKKNPVFCLKLVSGELE